MKNKLLPIFLSFSIFILTTPVLARLRVVATTPDLADIAKEVGGDQVDVKALAKGYQDPHFVDPKPSFIISLQKADLLIFNGLGLEIGWLPPLIESTRNGKIIYGADGYLDASVNIVPCELPTGKRSELRAQGDVHPAGNPHYMLDPENAKIVAREICTRLVKLSPENADSFNANCDKYIKELRNKLKEWDAKMAQCKGKKLINYHRLWTYFNRRFTLHAVAEVEPKPGIPPSPAHVANLIRYIPESGARVLVMAPYYSEKVPKLLAKKTGIKVLVLPTMPGGVKGVGGYISMMDYIVNRLSSELVKEKAVREEG